jgi:hypothetical protein
VIPPVARRFASRCDQINTPGEQIHHIFEGTEQIQQLVISRAISGMRIVSSFVTIVFAGGTPFCVSGNARCVEVMKTS